MISVEVKLFAVAKDLTGLGELRLSLQDGATAAQVVDHLISTHPSFSGWRNHVRLAVNSEYVEPSHPLDDGDEVAIIPPVSGG